MNNNFYEGEDHKDILKQLIQKGREEELLINVLCESNEIVREISNYLWNHSIPHYVKGDPYIEKNNIFVSEIEMPAEMLICYETNQLKDEYKFEKKCFIGIKNNLEGRHWLKINNKWKEVVQ